MLLDPITNLFGGYLVGTALAVAAWLLLSPRGQEEGGSPEIHQHHQRSTASKHTPRRLLTTIGPVRPDAANILAGIWLLPCHAVVYG